MQNKPTEIWKLDSFNRYYIKTANMAHRQDVEEKIKSRKQQNWSLLQWKACVPAS